MSQTGAIWLVILAALVAANLPFLNHRVALVGPLASPRKGLLVRLVELVVLYFLVGGFAMLLERRAGRMLPRGGSSTSSSLCCFSRWRFRALCTGTFCAAIAEPVGLFPSERLSP